MQINQQAEGLRHCFIKCRDRIQTLVKVMIGSKLRKSTLEVSSDRVMKDDSEYNQMGDAYSNDLLNRDDRTNVLAPSALHYLGQLEGKSVLDLACGDGFFSRLIKDQGAEKVVGVDISATMINRARELEAQNAQPIEYHVGDVAELPKFGDFEIVFGGFLLHCSPNVETLYRMAKKIRANMKDDGLFVAFNENPFFPMHSGIEYGSETVAIDPVEDGSQIKRIHYQGENKLFEFTHYHFSPETYEAALRAAGFKHIEWKPFILADGADIRYCDEYLNRFSITVLIAR